MKEEIAKAMTDPIRRFPWRLLGLKLALLLSFCGGPLALSDSLKGRIDGTLAFVIGFAPIVALVFGAYSVRTSYPDLWDKWMVWFGCIGAVALVAMNIFGVWQLTVTPDRADAGLIKFGIAVGTATAVYYAYASLTFFRNARHSF